MRPDTLLVHAGEPRPRESGAVAMPIYQSSTFEEREARGYHDIRYARLSNTPSHEALHGKLAALEQAEAALATASGMAAVSATLLSLLRAGDHVLAQEGLYGGTHDLMKHDLPRLGISVTFVPGDDPAAWRGATNPRTRVFYLESITNPLLRIADLRAAAAFARERNLISVVDNTFATPLAFHPLRQGFDLVLHSATKYLNGHNDLIAGAVMGSSARVREVKRTLDHLGGSLDPHACFLLQRGLKTLGVRYRQQCATALSVARFLAQHPSVLRVNHPGLESHPQHARARELFAWFGAMLSFEPKGGAEAAERLFTRLKIPLHAPSLGGTESLVTRPAASSHAGLSPQERASLGISDGLIRVSIGLESVEDLIEDFDRALRE
ncbi:MAG TPA: aminotransferase class I/II-fold pyridoxal phosphate-dependent enzyme [Myxococcales bacterium]|nr:aminotransferase class I/II-fold pyridoxal phosphate-dependent enzyme [Myxococcales bacterium]